MCRTIVDIRVSLIDRCNSDDAVEYELARKLILLFVTAVKRVLAK